MSLFKTLLSKKIWMHVLIALVLSLVLFWLVLSMLDRYTRHGQVYVIPDFYGLDHEEVIRQYDGLFKFIIADSIYDREAVYGTVLQQDPYAGAKVKKGRNVYIVTVAKQPEKIRMPNLENLSLRQAMVSLESAGLVLNTITFTNHFARNAVVRQSHEGKAAVPGDLLFRGSLIDLVLGDGGSLEKVSFPMIYGKSPAEARSLLQTVALNIGNEYYIDDYDKSNARVFKIQPYYPPGQQVNPGTFITIWYRSASNVDFNKYIRDSLFIEEVDSNSINTEDDF